MNKKISIIAIAGVLLTALILTGAGYNDTLTTTSHLTGYLKQVSVSSSCTIGTNCDSTSISGLKGGTYWITSASTLTLSEVVTSSPTTTQVIPGASFCVKCAVAGVCRVDPHANDRLKSGATAFSNGVDIYSSGTEGDEICFEAEPGAAGWTRRGVSGTWAQGT